MIKAKRLALLALLVCAGAFGGCTETELRDAAHTSGKLIYDTLKATKEAEQKGY